MDGRERKDVRQGLRVDIVLKQDQRTGRLTRGGRCLLHDITAVRRANHWVTADR